MTPLELYVFIFSPIMISLICGVPVALALKARASKTEERRPAAYAAWHVGAASKKG